MMYGPITTPAATGGAGVAAGTRVSDHAVSGILIGVFIQYNDAPPAGTTDVGIKTVGASGTLPSIPLLTISNAATDGYYIPKAPEYTAAGVATGGYGFFNVNDKIQVDMAGANNDDTVSVWLDIIPN